MLEGTFDLSLRGNAGQYLSISTGYKKEKKAENARKTQIWFVPRLLIEKELTTTAEHFKSIYGKWTAEVGIFWTGERDDKLGWYDYLTTKNMDNLSKISLYENWQCATPSYEVMGMDSWRGCMATMVIHARDNRSRYNSALSNIIPMHCAFYGVFHFHFEKCVKDEDALI